jgi:hypothetical protein
MKAVAVLIHILMFAIFDEGALNLIRGLKAQRDLHSITDAPDIELRHRRAFAGMDVLGCHNDPEFAVDFDDIAFAQRAGDDFHGSLNGFRNPGAPY